MVRLEVLGRFVGDARVGFSPTAKKYFPGPPFSSRAELEKRERERARYRGARGGGHTTDYPEGKASRRVRCNPAAMERPPHVDDTRWNELLMMQRASVVSLSACLSVCLSFFLSACLSRTLVPFDCYSRVRSKICYE